MVPQQYGYLNNAWIMKEQIDMLMWKEVILWRSQHWTSNYQQLITVERENFDLYSEEEYTIGKQALKMEFYLRGI